LPCFALTETAAGSDATSIISNGVLFKDLDGKLKIRMNWSKRYITLGAYATVIGVEIGRAHV
jgi:acyl-CoA dehydrogenase